MVPSFQVIHNTEAPFAQTGKQWVASDKTHCKPFDLRIPKQWVFGYTLSFILN